MKSAGPNIGLKDGRGIVTVAFQATEYYIFELFEFVAATYLKRKTAKLRILFCVSGERL